MRTSRLRRWLIRGVLISATVAGPFVAAGPASAEWTWNDVPPAGSQVDKNPAPLTVERPTANEWTWN